MKPNSQEFFTEFDPLYRTHEKQAALRKQKELFVTSPSIAEQWDEYNARFKALANWARSAADPFGMALSRGKEGTGLAAVWTKHRQGRVGFADPEHPFRLQGSADLNSYKMFTEVFWSLLQAEGRLGIIVPSGLYSDSGTRELRETLLERGAWDWLFCFENKKRIFDIHGSFKFGPVIAAKSKCQIPMKTAFMVHDLADWERSDPPAIVFDPASLALFSPRSKSLPEVRTARDYEIARKIYAHSIRIGDMPPAGRSTTLVSST